MKHSFVRHVRTVALVLVGLAFLGSVWAKEIIEIPSLDDESFMAKIRQLEEDIRVEPTNRENFGERADLVRLYYNALQADGVSVPWFALIVMNVLQSRSDDPDMLFQQYATGFDIYFRGFRRLHEQRGEIGSIAVVEPRKRSLEARAYTTIRVVYRVGKMPLRTGAMIRFAPNWMNDMSPIQLTRPLFPGYTTVQASDPAVRLTTGMEYWQSVYGSLYPPGAPRAMVTVAEGELTEGDTVTFVIGERSQGGPGLLIQSSTTDRFPLRFEVDFEGTGFGWAPVGEPIFSVYGSAPHHIRAFAPSTVRAGERFSVRASVEDRYFNRAIGGPRALTLWLDGKQVAKARPTRSDRAIFHFDRLVFPENREGPLVFEVKDTTGRLRGRSNPVNLIGPDDPYVFWGELHGHEGYTDGTGTADWYMRYARDVGFLDFVSLTGHDLMMSETYQRDVQRATEEYYEPNKFVTFKAYEWTQDARYGGHHNVYYRDMDQRIIPCNEAPRISDLYRLQRQVNDPTKVLIIPHCHQPGDWNFNDAQLERLVEVYSMHGSFEWFGRRYLERGYHVGLLCASDDHTGHPGNNPARKSQRGGLAAVFAQERTRESIFDALVARRVYGTTLARIFLDVRVAGAPMGTETEVARPDPPSLEVSGVVSGTAPIARIVAVCNGKDVEELNLLQPDEGEGKAALRVMITSSSEPAGKRVLPPLARARWWGRVSLQKTRIETTTPLGLDGLGDNFVQTGDQRVDFVCATTGDKDGVLLELDGWTPNDKLRVEILESPDVHTGRREMSWEMPLWGERRTSPVKTIEIPLALLDEAPQLREFGDNSAVIAERVGGDLAAHKKFTIQVSDGLKPDEENYVYVRVEQIDDETVWSSPVWVTWRE